LALAAVEDSLGKHMSFFQVLTEDVGDPLEKVNALIDGIVSYHAARKCSPGCFFGKFAQEVGDASPALAGAATRFFDWWGEFLASFFEQAKGLGLLRAETDGTALSLLVISSIEGALLVCKASGDVGCLIRIGETLKAVIDLHRSERAG